MKATWNDAVLAEVAQDELIKIEGNWYFPPNSLNREYFTDSEHKTVCFWKGESSYYDIVVGDETNEAAAFYYAEPKDGSTERVGKDFTNYVSFWHGVEVSE